VDNPKKPLHAVKPLTSGEVALAVRQMTERAFLSSDLLPVSVRPLFSFGFGSRKRKKLSKKEKRRKGFRALRSATKGAALESRDLLKKVDQNFSFDNAWSKKRKFDQNFGI
jgi:hypothetical protein